jgi:hypothetical protein
MARFASCSTSGSAAMSRLGVHVVGRPPAVADCCHCKALSARTRAGRYRGRRHGTTATHTVLLTRARGSRASNFSCSPMAVCLLGTTITAYLSKAMLRSSSSAPRSDSAMQRPASLGQHPAVRDAAGSLVTGAIEADAPLCDRLVHEGPPTLGDAAAHCLWRSSSLALARTLLLSV